MHGDFGDKVDKTVIGLGVLGILVYCVDVALDSYHKIQVEGWQEHQHEKLKELVQNGALPLDTARARQGYYDKIIEELADEYGGHAQLFLDQQGYTNLRMDESMSGEIRLEIGPAQDSDQVAASLVFNGATQDPEKVATFNPREAVDNISPLVEHARGELDKARDFGVQEKAFGTYLYSDGNVTGPKPGKN